MRFGEGKGTFGVWMPGKRVEAFHMEDIPEPLKIGPYRNFIIHTGVNNIKRRDRHSNISLVNEMESKMYQHFRGVSPLKDLHKFVAAH